ncbi:hypothetical protein AAFF_G00209330 [Aldrovandia affinis]|uniref:Rho GTPase-activating protein 20 n=1 Tax=Aldrovandia affinis TaxID=143900 RepID=A0AAD7SW54_9TELE|nr:hypothetical protein AAFF_G00209330 [Aldrovandia affinis]
METMSPQQENSVQSRSASLTGETKICTVPDNKKKMKTLIQRRQSAPSLVISKALTKSRTISRENCLSPISPETCPLVQSFLTPARMFVTHGHAQLKTGLQTQERHLFLFSDILLIAKAKSSTHFKLKAQVRVCEMWTAGCMEEVCEGSTSPERSFVMGWPTFNCVATFSSMEQKERWLSFIKSRIKEEKEKEDPKTILLKILAKDMGNCAFAKTVTVGHSDCVTEVIHMALQQFGISGCVKDYQLWASSRKDEPPYPLIGHEFPFSIKMSHIREKDSHGGGVKDPINPLDLLEQLPLDTQCQFILKPSRVAGGQSVLEPALKPLRRKRSIINWAFWRSSSSQLDGPPTSPSSPAPGHLFGLSLSTVCEGDALPKPVMDMLIFLYQEGPFTRGIFRRSASAKACREMRDRLNAGADCPPLTPESIFVTAAVFKDFLRHIPGSLLCQDLYEQWLGVMEQAGEEEDKVQAIQRLVQQLPKENQLLLRHMLAVLHCIQHNAHHNQMNSFNLSVCIAPSMLWAPAPCSPDIESEGTKKVSEVVRFMIEHCHGVLGDDVTSLFGGFLQKGNGHISADVSTVHLNDSSYDSLENELNDDTESPFQVSQGGRKDKQENRSRDSVITLSDCDLDQSDPDPVPMPVHLQLPPLAHPRRFTPASHQPHSPTQRDTSERDPLCPKGNRRLRRCSEPAIGHPASSLVPNLEQHSIVVRKASYDATTNHSKDKVFMEHLHNLSQDDRMAPGGCGGGGDEGGAEDKRSSRDIPRRKHKQPPPLHLDISCSSLSSPATSPSGSSMSSLDSAFSQCSTDCMAPIHSDPCSITHRALGCSSPNYPAPTSPRSPVAIFPLSSNSIPSSSTTCPRELCEWSQHRITHGLHPNTWLKRGRRLSLRQQDKSGWEEEETREPGCGPDNRTLPSNGSSGMLLSSDRKAHGLGDTSKKRSNSPPSYQQAILQIQGLRSPFFKDKVLTVKELRQLHDQASVKGTGSDITHKNTSPAGGSPPQSVFFGHSSCLTLQRQKSHSLIPAVEGSGKDPIRSRRASEPLGESCLLGKSADLERLHKQALDNARKTSASKIPQESEFKVSGEEPLHSSASQDPEPRLCLSSSATQVVRDYFSHTHADPDSCLRTSQEVAIAIAQGKQEWRSRRCSDPRFDDLDQMFFAEESYV